MRLERAMEKLSDEVIIIEPPEKREDRETG